MINMEDVQDFNYFQNLIDIQKIHEENILYNNDKILLDLNNFTDSNWRFHKNICFGINII